MQSNAPYAKHQTGRGMCQVSLYTFSPAGRHILRNSISVSVFILGFEFLFSSLRLNMFLRRFEEWDIWQALMSSSQIVRVLIRCRSLCKVCAVRAVFWCWCLWPCEFYYSYRTYRLPVENSEAWLHVFYDSKALPRTLSKWRRPYEYRRGSRFSLVFSIKEKEKKRAFYRYFLLSSQFVYIYI